MALGADIAFCLMVQEAGEINCRSILLVEKSNSYAEGTLYKSSYRPHHMAVISYTSLA